MDTEAMRQLTDSWQIAMEATMTSPNTVRDYTTGLRLYLDWCDAQGAAEGAERPDAVRRWLASLAGRGQAAATVNLRLSALRSFERWAVAEGELPAVELDRVKRAKQGEHVPDYLTEAQRDALLATCGRDFYGLRDAAMISLMYDSLLRADEAASIRARGDIDLRRRTVKVRRGKGGKERGSGFSPQTAQRLDRYNRARARHRHAASDAYWVGAHGTFSYKGIWEMFRKRGERAGLAVHPHMTRNGGAVQWKRDGGTTEGLMTIGGWSNLSMVQHYVRAAAIELAQEEQQRLFGKRR